VIPMDTVDKESEEARHPIQVVSRRTGLSPDVIRVWERRYRAVEPRRSATNRRLYSDRQIERLSLLRRATLAGRSIGDVARLDPDALRTLVETDERAAAEAPRTPHRLAPARARILFRAALEAVGALDPLRLRMTLSSAAIELDTATLLDDVVRPLMRAIGDRWEVGSIGIAHEHLATAVVRALLDSIREARGSALDGPEIVVATPPGQRHEIGALMVSAAAAAAGWRPTHLGADLPADEIAESAIRRNASAIAVSLVHPEADPSAEEELRRLRRRVGPSMPILVGGRAAHSYREVLREIGASTVETLAELAAALDGIAPTP